jgi:putative FmdB family regulatory protein
MPIYDYKCLNCGHELELIQKINDEEIKKCPNCNQNTLKKQISAPSFRLKGSGWYETDFKTGKKKNLVAKDDGKSNVKIKDDLKNNKGQEKK